MDNGHVIRTVFKNIPNNWPIWADGLNEFWGIWGIMGIPSENLSTHFVIVFF